MIGPIPSAGSSICSRQPITAGGHGRFVDLVDADFFLAAIGAISPLPLRERSDRRATAIRVRGTNARPRTSLTRTPRFASGPTSPARGEVKYRPTGHSPSTIHSYRLGDFDAEAGEADIMAFAGGDEADRMDAEVAQDLSAEPDIAPHLFAR